MRQCFFTFLCAIVVSSCSSPKESIMPFRNLIYAGERQFLVAENNSEFTFKASFNISTSVDRLITISKDSILGYQGNLLEIFSLPAKKHQPQYKFIQRTLTPKSGFKRFIEKIDSMNLSSVKNQENFNIGLHQPFSLYVIELKQKDRYTHFKFNAYLSKSERVEPRYEQIVNLIFQEFDFPLYLK